MNITAHKETLTAQLYEALEMGNRDLFETILNSVPTVRGAIYLIDNITERLGMFVTSKESLQQSIDIIFEFDFSTVKLTIK